MQHVEAYPVPFPVLAVEAGQEPRGLRTERVILRQGGGDPADRHGVQHGRRAADVIDVVVGEHETVEPCHTGRTQKRHDDAIAGVGVAAVVRAGVVEQGVMTRLRDHRESLPHVEHRETQRARLDQLWTRREERHEADEPDPARREPPRQEEPRHAREGERHRPERGGVTFPDSGVSVTQGIEKLHAKVEDELRDRQQEPERRDSSPRA